MDEMPQWAKALLPALAKSRRAWRSVPAEQMRRAAPYLSREATMELAERLFREERRSDGQAAAAVPKGV